MICLKFSDGSSVVNKACCSSWGLEFIFQHPRKVPYNHVYFFTTQSSGFHSSLLWFVHTTHRHTCINLIKIKIELQNDLFCCSLSIDSWISVFVSYIRFAWVGYKLWINVWTHNWEIDLNEIAFILSISGPMQGTFKQRRQLQAVTPNSFSAGVSSAQSS